MISAMLLGPSTAGTCGGVHIDFVPTTADGMPITLMVLSVFI